MQFPIVIGLRRSFFLDAGLLAIGIALAMLALAAPHSSLIRVIGLLLGWVALAGAWRQSRPSFVSIRMERAGQLAVARRDGETFAAAELLPGATVHPWLTVFRVKTGDGRRHTVVCAVDSLTAEDFRRLRVFLRWRAAFNAADGDA